MHSTGRRGNVLSTRTVGVRVPRAQRVLHGRGQGLLIYRTRPPRLWRRFSVHHRGYRRQVPPDILGNEKEGYSSSPHVLESPHSPTKRSTTRLPSGPRLLRRRRAACGPSQGRKYTPTLLRRRPRGVAIVLRLCVLLDGKGRCGGDCIGNKASQG